MFRRSILKKILAPRLPKKIEDKIIFDNNKQKTRFHHQHKNWERSHRDYNAKIMIFQKQLLIIKATFLYLNHFTLFLPY